jgi:hypothetical protein
VAPQLLKLAHLCMRACHCSAETRGHFEQQLRAIVRGTKTLDAVLAEDGTRYKTAFEAATAQSQVRFSSSSAAPLQPLQRRAPQVRMHVGSYACMAATVRRVHQLRGGAPQQPCMYVDPHACALVMLCVHQLRAALSPQPTLVAFSPYNAARCVAAAALRVLCRC